MPDIFTVLRGHGLLDEIPPRPKILTEAAVMTLSETFGRYTDQLTHGPRFKPGDWVTPVTTGAYTDFGEPHIVLEVYFEADTNAWVPPTLDEPPKKRLDIRVAKVIGGSVYTYWCESFEFEAWVNKKVEKAKG